MSITKTIVNLIMQMELLGSYDFWNEVLNLLTRMLWCSDFDLSWYEIPDVGRIHGGFMKALGLQKCLGWPKEMKQSSSRPAPLAYYALRDILKGILSQNDQTKYISDRLQGIYTFGQPRVGDGNFGKYMENMLEQNTIPYYRFVYGSDIVPRLPYDDKALMFKHFGTCLYYNRNMKYRQVVEEEPNKNYFSLRGAIPMMVNAFFELIRSFTISITRGREYKERWFLRGFRVTGLLLPGVPAHLIQDYVNSTRLGSANVFLSGTKKQGVTKPLTFCKYLCKTH
ncbi:hypothetical protein NC652_018283 [Populus alba x Populus x berolinensis]|nr:hypothetical protein NC652_018283 [Populus alba x Populus x berolinensis]